MTTITEDTANQPAVVNTSSNWQTTPLVTAAFTPPDSRLLVALAQGGNSTTSTTITAGITDSVGGTWTLLRRETSVALGMTAEVWCRWIATSPGSMTVTSTASSTATPSGGALVVRSLITASDTQPGFADSTTVNPSGPVQLQVNCGYTNMIYGVANNFSDSTAMTVLANTTAISAVVDSFNANNWSTFKSTADTAGNDIYGYSTSKQGLIVTVEILDTTVIGPGDATPPPPIF